MNSETVKPLGTKLYGSIPHLPGSRRGPADKGVNDGQFRICCEKTPPDRRGDVLWVTEKLDGSNCGVAKINGTLVALGRAGYPAESSTYVHHHLFHDWVGWPENQRRFDALLGEGERVIGEWLVLAHGTRYLLTHEPFVVFDLIRPGGDRKGTPNRLGTTELTRRCEDLLLTTPRLLHGAGPLSIAAMRAKLEDPPGGGHGAIDPVEGAVWKVERGGEVDFLAKYVRPEKVDGAYLFERDTRGQVILPPRECSILTWNRWPGKEVMTSRYATWRGTYR